MATSYDFANNPMTYAYNGTGGCNSIFPTSVTKGGLTTYATWNCTGGVKLTDKDASGNTTTYGYVTIGGAADPFWRVMSVTDPLSNVVYRTYPSSTTSNSSFTFNSGLSIQNTTVTTDGYGRTTNVQTQQGPSSSNYDTTSTSYGWSGNYKTVSTAPPCTTTLGSACVTSHTNSYDSLGRLYQAVTTSNETATKTYTQNDVVTTLSPPPTGENNKSTQKEYDSLGRITSVCSIMSSGGYTSCSQNSGTYAGIFTTTSYTSASGSQTVTITRGLQTRSRTVDGLGRVTSETNPESGTTQYFWDAAPSACGSGGWSTPGDLGAKKDNAGVYTCYGYDALHRLLGSGHGTGTDCRGFVYDSGNPPAGITVQNTAGRLVEAYTNSACNGHASIVTDEWFSYDARGQMTDMWETTPHSGGWYHTTASYFANGALHT